MKNAARRTAGLAMLVLLLTVSAPALSDRSSEAIFIPRDVTFGTVRVRAGIYLAREASNGAIELESTIDGTTVSVPAEAGRHSQSIQRPMSIAVQADASQLHLLLLDPDGTQRRAVASTGRAGRVTPVATPAESVQAEVQRVEGRVPQLTDASPQAGRLAPRVSGAEIAQQTLRQSAAEQAEDEAAAGAAEEEPAPEYMFQVPLNMQALPASVEHVNVWIMLGTAAYSDDPMGTSVGGGGQPVGWGSARVDVPANGALQRTVPVPVDWYGPGPSASGELIPFPSHYVVYITLSNGGPTACGSNTDWESQGRCGTTLRSRVTGSLPDQ